MVGIFDLAAQAGVALKFDLGPVNLGALCNYLFTDGYTLNLDRTRDSVLEENIPEDLDVELETNSIGGHKVQLKLEIKPGDPYRQLIQLHLI